MVRPSDCLEVGWQALRAHTGRSLLTTLGIVAGVAAVICTMSIGAGAEDEVAERLRSLGANLLMVTPGAAKPSGVRMEAGLQRNLTEADAAAIGSNIPGVEGAAPLVARRLQIIAGNRNWSTLVAGVTPAYLAEREWSAEEGRLFETNDLESAARLAIIGSDVADALFDGRSPVGKPIRIGAVPVTVVAVLARKGVGAAGRSQDDVVFVPLTMARTRLLGEANGLKRNALDLISVKLADPAHLPDAKSQIETLLRQRHRLLLGDLPDDFAVDNPADVLEARAGAARALAWLLFGSAAVSLAVGGISLMNIMLVSVGERTREFGVRMAVGAGRRDLLLQMLVETTALALAGGLVGSLVGIAASVGIASQAQWRVSISILAVLMAWGLAGAVGFVFGLYPAYRASRLDPIEALRGE
jgi:putative ABC transport system permease protein